ncbi:MAG: DedA family protein [Dehalococcoidia bacterium]|nr:MAG: DedA family protein [Dehalococcoidia bacterium]UCG84007.1 MAG: DedA family protein [Dehalococcoidia bacterium]
MKTDNTPYDAVGTTGEDTVNGSRERLKTANDFILSRKMLIRIVAILFVIAVSATIFVLRDQVSNLESYGYLGVFLIALITTATIILPVPGIVFIATLSTVPGYNPVLIGLAAGAGSALGELTGYTAGFSGQLVFENNKYYKQLEKWMRKSGSIVILILSFVPNPIFDIAGATAGVLRYPVWKFLIACFAGKTLRYIMVAAFGWFVGTSWF